MPWLSISPRTQARTRSVTVMLFQSSSGVLVAQWLDPWVGAVFQVTVEADQLLVLW
jgi:hypothetical protein